MESDVMTNVLLQVPALGVVVYLVIHFLAYLKTSREDERVFMTDLVKDQSSTIERNSNTIKRSYESIDENTKVLARTQLVIEQHIAKCPLQGVPDSRCHDDCSDG